MRKTKDKIPFREPEKKFRLSFFTPFVERWKSWWKEKRKIAELSPKIATSWNISAKWKKKIVEEKSEKFLAHRRESRKMKGAKNVSNSCPFWVKMCGKHNENENDSKTVLEAARLLNLSFKICWWKSIKKYENCVENVTKREKSLLNVCECVWKCKKAPSIFHKRRKCSRNCHSTSIDPVRPPHN